MYNGTWTLNYCSHLHTEKSSMWLCFLSPWHTHNSLSRCRRKSTENKKARYWRQEHKVEELTSGKEHSLIRGNHSGRLKILRIMGGAMGRINCFSDSHFSINCTSSPVSILNCWSVSSGGEGWSLQRKTMKSHTLFYLNSELISNLLVLPGLS